MNDTWTRSADGIPLLILPVAHIFFCMTLRRRVARIDGRRAKLAPAVTTLWAVEEEISAGKTFPPLRVDRLSLLATVTGRVVDLDDANRPVHTPTSVSVLPPGAAYHDRVLPASSWQLRYVMFKGPWGDQFCREFTGGRAPRTVVIDPAPAAFRRQLSEIVTIALDQPRGWQWMLLSRLSSLLGAIADMPAPLPRESDLAQRLRRLVDADPRRSWSIEELAEVLEVAPSTVAHRFKQSTGISPALWVRRCRVDAAREMLAQGLTVVETAQRMGFANPYHFSRLFKAVTGAAPSTVAQAAKAGRTLH